MDVKSIAVPLSKNQERIDVAGFCSDSCPYLGSRQDQITPMAFADSRNRCFRGGHGLHLDLDYQRSFCLVAEYNSCDIYNAGEEESHPEDALSNQHAKRKGLRLVVPVFVAIFVVSLVVSFSFFNFGNIGLPALNFNIPRGLIEVQVLIQEFAQDELGPLPFEIIESGKSSADGPATSKMGSEPNEPVIEKQGMKASGDEGSSFRPIQYGPN